jgi:hypothetical protein
VDNTVVQDLPGSSPAGRYTVLWRVTSADGHPVSGQISFTSRAASPAKAPETTAAAPVVEHATGSGSGLPVGAMVAALIVVAILAAMGWEVQRRRARGTKGM